MSSRNFIPFVQLKLRWNFGGQIKSTTHRWLAASLGFRIWQPLPMFTYWFCHDILWNKVQLCLQIGYTVILHSLSWFLCKDNFLDLFFFFFFFLIFHVIFMPKHTCTALKLHTTKVNWPCYTPVSWWPFILHALGAWCSLGHGRKFIKDAPSACRINGHINHFDMKLVMFLINVEKKPRLLFWCIFFLKFCLKK